MNRPTLSAIWHEGIGGRLGKEIASVVFIMLNDSLLREKTALTVWLDNCAPQNKNYTFFTTLWALVHSDIVDLDTITLKYFVSGHAFMAADNVHAAVEREMKKAKNVIDLNHFSECVKRATSNTTVFKPDCRDFLDLQPHSSARRLERERPKLSELSVIEFRRGSKVLYVKRKFKDDFMEFDYLRKNTKRSGVDLESVPPLYQRARGVCKTKKDELMKGIVPIIRTVDNGRHERRARFYERLPTSDNVADLATSDDEDRDGADE